MRQAPQASASNATRRDRSLPRAWKKIALAAVIVAALASVSSPTASAACPNEEFRSGASAQLPNCRAYEIVTPPKLNGLPQAGTGAGGLSLKFNSPTTTPDGNNYVWMVAATGIPGTGSSGYFNLYQAKRSGSDWSSLRLSPGASESQGSDPGAVNGDLGYSTFQVEAFRGGSLAPCPFCGLVAYVRYPDGSFHLLGEGTVPTATDTDNVNNGFIDDLSPAAFWISPDGSHQLFGSGVRLTSNAPSGKFEIYDRTPSGLKLVSILPGGASPTESSTFEGNSENGSIVLFKHSGNLYARVDNDHTVEVASGSGGAILSGGVSANGTRAFFAQQGNLFAYNLEAKVAIPVVSSGNATFVNVSADGSHVYFISPTQLVPGKGVSGQPNLYVWNGSSIVFIATTPNSGELLRGFGPTVGLEMWSEPNSLEVKVPARNDYVSANTSRTTPNGKIFVFESQAQLTTYPNGSHIELYRFDTETNVLSCVSCSRSESSATGNSQLVSDAADPPISNVYLMNLIPNLSSDGSRVVFESKDSLLSRDGNGVSDVYQWEQGNLSLISTGDSSQPSKLFGVSPSGNDIFFATGKRLVAQGQEGGSIAVYDARVGGGLASQQTQQPVDCIGDACQGQPAVTPQSAVPGSSTFKGKGNLKKGCRHRRHKRHRRHEAQAQNAHPRQSARTSKRKAPKKSCARTRRGSAK